jgi:uncharacterized protein (TIGR02147 family)
MNSDLIKQLLWAEDYRVFLREYVQYPGSLRGLRKRLAESAGCQPAYFSQVLSGDSHLTPEQAEKLCAFWELPELETEYFFTLVLENRAGTTSLRSFLQRKREDIRKQFQDESFRKPSLQKFEWAEKYYSHWIYSAVHILISVPSLQTAEDLARHLGRSLESVEMTLNELSDMKLAQCLEGRWLPLDSSLYAGDSGLHTELHHRNWRTHVTNIQGEPQPGEMRYTCVHSLSRADFLRVREMLREQIRQSRSLLEPSPSEMCACLMIDWIEI